MIRLSMCVLAISLITAACTQSSIAACPYLSEYITVSKSIERLPPAQAATALERYTQTHENPEACESIEIQKRLSDLEKNLFDVDLQGQRLISQMVLRCYEIDTRTARCRGPMEDDTAHAFSARIVPLTAVPNTPMAIITTRPNATLEAVYIVSLADALDGKSATPVACGKNELVLPKALQDSVLIAIFRSDGAWKFRKAVWYF